MGMPELRPACLRLHFLLFLLFSLSLGPFSARALDRHTTTTFDVGVVLDTTTWIGNISWTCMVMAIEDFYAVHHNLTTRLALHPRESGEDAFGAASAAIDLLKNDRVQAIIGPQTSTQAKFLIELGSKTQVPIISFSAKSPSLSKQSPYFIRTALNDSSQAKAIGSIVHAFNWSEVVPVFEDTDYGAGIVPYLIGAFQDIGARVPYRSMIPLSATKNQISEELNKLKNMTTRVFVVHMSYSLGLQLFSNAKEDGMMGNGYVWIITYGLTDLVDIMGLSATDVMQGVLGVKPYVDETRKQLRDFRVRWRERFNQTPPNAGVTGPSVSGLWAYDTVWSLALAAEQVGANSLFLEQDITNSSTDLTRLGRSQTGPKLLRRMQDTTLDGMSGKFCLIDGQLEVQAFEIINVVGHAKKRVGFWTPAHGIKADLKEIKWPGEQTAVPEGWEWPGKTLQILVPVKKHGFEKFVDLGKNGSDKGYCIEVFDAVMKALPFNVTYEYQPFVDDKGESNGTYDELVYQVYLQKYDAVVGDVTIIANRSLYVDFTLPYTVSAVSVVVPIKDERHKTAWTFLEPLSTNLWLASAAYFVFTGFVVWFLEHRINDEFRGTPAYQLGTIFYFIFSTLVFACKEKLVSNYSRVVVIIWVFVVLILTQSYTASLTSMLTEQQLQPEVNDLNDIIRYGYSVGYMNDSFVKNFLNRMKIEKTIPYSSTAEYNEALSNGSVAAIVDEIPYLKMFLSQYCNNYTMVGPSYKTGGFGFVFPKGSPLVPHVSRAILNITENDTLMAVFENELYGDRTCLMQGGSKTTSIPLTFKSFWGLFLITGGTSMLALLLHLVFFLYEHRDKLRDDDDSENSVRQKLALLAKLYHQLETSHASKKTDTNDGAATGDIIASPYTISTLQSPSSMSDHRHSNFGPEEEVGAPLEEEGSPGREISSQNPDPPSFSEMLNERSRRWLLLEISPPEIAEELVHEMDSLSGM